MSEQPRRVVFRRQYIFSLARQIHEYQPADIEIVAEGMQYYLALCLKNPPRDGEWYLHAANTLYYAMWIDFLKHTPESESLAEQHLTTLSLNDWVIRSCILLALHVKCQTILDGGNDDETMVTTIDIAIEKHLKVLGRTDKR